MPHDAQGPLYMEENLDLTVRDVLGIMQSRIMTRTTYFGIRTLKCPADFWVSKRSSW
jgi:hypothetical protein